MGDQEIMNQAHLIEYARNSGISTARKVLRHNIHCPIANELIWTISNVIAEMLRTDPVFEFNAMKRNLLESSEEDEPPQSHD